MIDGDGHNLHTKDLVNKSQVRFLNQDWEGGGVGIVSYSSVRLM